MQFNLPLNRSHAEQNVTGGESLGRRRGCRASQAHRDSSGQMTGAAEVVNLTICEKLSRSFDRSESLSTIENVILVRAKPAAERFPSANQCER